MLIRLQASLVSLQFAGPTVDIPRLPFDSQIAFIGRSTEGTTNTAGTVIQLSRFKKIRICFSFPPIAPVRRFKRHSASGTWIQPAVRPIRLSVRNRWLNDLFVCFVIVASDFAFRFFFQLKLNEKLPQKNDHDRIIAQLLQQQARALLETVQIESEVYCVFAGSYVLYSLFRHVFLLARLQGLQRTHLRSNQTSGA